MLHTGVLVKSNQGADKLSLIRLATRIWMSSLPTVTLQENK